MEQTQPRDGGWAGARLESAEFRRLAAFIEGHCGIRMPASKRVMLEPCSFAVTTQKTD